jgi:hypothetical protein
LSAVVTDFRKSQKVALQNIPERPVIPSEIPAASSGKSQKVNLRDIVKQSAGQHTARRAT